MNLLNKSIWLPALAGAMLVLTLAGFWVFYSNSDGDYRVLNNYFAIDESRAYVYDIGTGGPFVIPEADVKTFTSTGKDTAKDSNHLYGISAKGYLTIDGELTGPQWYVDETAASQTNTNSSYRIVEQKTLPTTADLSASIDTKVLTSSLSTVTITGTASGTLTGLLGMSLYKRDPDYYRYYSGDVSFFNGRWSATHDSELPPGRYIIDMYVLDGHSDYGSNNVVTTATLIVE